ncbi:C4-dicarboxylate ABC transporter substrate-binding protein [Gammaproteobacteria bacterium]|nr:C4-dicarboxylate ABC transporter substrate-binding protein [Gammaproteobacteria bacterium]
MKIKSTLLSISLGMLIATAAQAQINARLGHAMPQGHPQATGLAEFAKLADKYTEGRLKVTVYDGAQLGGDEKMLRSVQAGTQDLYMGGVAPLTGRIKELQIFDFPFMFTNVDEAMFVLNGHIGQGLLNKMNENNLVGLTWADLGFRDLSNNKLKITKLEDMKGLKVRVMQNPVALDSWKALGTNAVAMSFSEVFTALETKALDAQENPLQHMYSNKMYEVQKYITLTHHVYTPVALVASSKLWAQLSDADKKGLQRAATESANFIKELNASSVSALEGQFKEVGVEISPLDPGEHEKMQAAIAPIITKYTDAIGADFVKEFYAEIEKARAQK